MIEKIKYAVHDQVSIEMIKHLGINKNLTSSEVNNLCNKLGYSQNILKKRSY